jgi:Leucine-rich repeat (LRR) protein
MLNEVPCVMQMRKAAFALLAVLALSAIVILGQGQTDQSATSAATPLPPNKVWYTYDPWIEQYANSLREYYGFEKCEYFIDGNYILFLFSDDGSSSFSLSLFDKEQEIFVDDLGKAYKLYYNYYLHKNKNEIVNSLRSKLNSQEANAEIIMQFSNSWAVKGGYLVADVTAWARGFLSCYPDLQCTLDLMQLAKDEELSMLDADMTYYDILDQIVERSSIYPAAVDKTEKAVMELKKQDLEGQQGVLEIASNSLDLLKIGAEVNNLPNVPSESLSTLDDIFAQRRRMEVGLSLSNTLASVVADAIITSGDYEKASRFGLFANWHAQVAEMYAKRARDELGLFEINPSIENYHKMVRDCTNAYDNLAIGYALLSAIVESQKNTNTGWAASLIAEKFDIMRSDLSKAFGINVQKPNDLIRAYQDLADKNLEWREDAQEMDAVFERNLLKQISQEMIVPGTSKSIEKTTTTEVEVKFPDPNLEAEIRAAINKPGGTIYSADLEELTILDVESSGIKNIAGLEHCTNLQDLSLGCNPITDISPLSGLTNLQNLNLNDATPFRHSQITDISPLSGLTNLQSLGLACLPITDISPLSGLTNLLFLNLNQDPIADISPLSGLTNLQTLWLNYDQIIDISPLAGLTNLQDLDLGGNNKITDVSPLSGLTNLQTLNLDANTITDISPLSGLTNLQTLWLRFNQIIDISPLAGLTNLQNLDLGYNKITDVSPLSGLTKLQTLSLGGNTITDISPLSGLTDFKHKDW